MHWSSPSIVTGTPFTFTGTDGIKLILDTSGVATSVTGVINPLTVSIRSPLSYQSHTGIINSGEGVSQNPVDMGLRVNNEISTIDDVGVVSEPDDAPLNVDFTNDSYVVFATPVGGLLNLIIAEDAGLDTFKLDFCGATDCSTYQTLFNGFTLDTISEITSLYNFDVDDIASGSPPDVDQMYLFLFDSPLLGYLRISETTEYVQTSEFLEIDFAGGNTAAVPEPGTLLLLGSGLAGITVFRKKLL